MNPYKANTLRTRKQVSTMLLAQGVAAKLRWKKLVAEARLTWPAVSTEELAKAQGDVPTLAGIVQLRCRFSREEADRQVKAFFEKHATTI